MTLSVTLEDPPSADAAQIRDGLIADTRSKVERPELQQFAIVVRDETGAVRGGLNAYFHWDMLMIDTIWVDNALRGEGLGRRLMRDAEAEAVRRGGAVVILDTNSWQARGFYEKLGYRVFGELPFAGGLHTKYYMAKTLERDP